jgi:acetyl-CoA acyltransferase
MAGERLTQAYICDYLRTPFGRYGGVLSSVGPPHHAAQPQRDLQLRHPQLDWSCLEDVCFGCANQAGEDNRNVARMAVLLAGLPQSVPASTVNRLCGSSLEATIAAARGIQTGATELVIAGGVESMSRAPYVMAKAESAFARGARLEDTTLGWRFINPRLEALIGCESMAQTAENLVAQGAITRADQDAFAWRSQQRYARALARGFFTREISPFTLTPARQAPVVITGDEQPRPDTTLEGLARLKGVVRPDGSVTAGNSSGINDGAAVLLLASEAAAKRHGLTPRARVLGAAVAGVAPRVMGRGPAPATEKLLAHTGVKLSELDVIELNEAFAAQALAVLRELGLPDDAEQVNPNGGAIAVGHPLGASGARLIMTALNQLDSSGGRLALCTMCIGVGQGIALLLERV